MDKSLHSPSQRHFNLTLYIPKYLSFAVIKIKERVNKPKLWNYGSAQERGLRQTQIRQTSKHK
jgi:hypothetical protein